MPYIKSFYFTIALWKFDAFLENNLHSSTFVALSIATIRALVKTFVEPIAELFRATIIEHVGNVTRAHATRSNFGFVISVPCFAVKSCPV